VSTDSSIAIGEPYITCDNLVRIFKVADLEVVALQGLDLIVNKGELMAIIGNSGSGKSTLLNVLGGLDRPSAGRCLVGGLDIVKASSAELVRYKRDMVGFVWQQSSRNMIPYLTANENVQAPMVFAGMSIKKRKARSGELLEAVGLTDRMHHRLGELSGGQQQRVAIAISLANNPDLLLADEPTGEVDNETAGHIYEILHDLNRNEGLTVVVVSHDRNIARQVDRVVAIRDGRTSTETVRRVAEDGLPQSHDEFVIIDANGRLQIPSEYLQELGIKERAIVDVEDGNVIIRKANEDISNGS